MAQPEHAIQRTIVHHCVHALQVAAFPKQNGSRPRTVVFTQGKDATVVASHGKVRQGSRPGIG